MSVQDDVENLHLRLTSTFDLVRKQKTLVTGTIALEDDFAQIESHYARYLCVLVSGYAEQASKSLLKDWAKTNLTKSSCKLFEDRLRKSYGMNDEKLETFARFLNTDLWLSLEGRCFVELQALNSVASQRNKIAHGGDSDITFAQIERYYQEIQKLVDVLSSTFQ